MEARRERAPVGPDARIARHADARKPFRVEENDFGAECLRRLRIRFERVEHSVDLGPPSIGGDEDPHQAARALSTSGARSSDDLVHRISISPFGFSTTTVQLSTQSPQLT